MESVSAEREIVLEAPGRRKGDDGPSFTSRICPTPSNSGADFALAAIHSDFVGRSLVQPGHLEHSGGV